MIILSIDSSSKNISDELLLQYIKFEFGKHFSGGEITHYTVVGVTTVMILDWRLLIKDSKNLFLKV